MPILHIQLAGQIQAPDGSVVAAPPSVILQQRGPVVQVSLTVEANVAKSLAEQGKALPNPVAGFALIDTGASVTCVDDAIAQQLGLPIIDVVDMCSATHENSKQNVYPVQISFVGFPIQLQASRAIGANLKSQGIVLLIGRDVLRAGTLHYNGVTGAFTLAI